MVNTYFKLELLLRQHKKTPLALAEASGLSKTTVYNLVNNKAKAVELETLDKLMAGLERLLGRPVRFDEILEKRPTPKEARLARLLKGVRPFHWEEVQKALPPLTPEEKAEDEAFLRVLEEARQTDLEQSQARDRRLLELFEEPGPKNPARRAR
ncbi:helix-turn-helix transcriptional regulator [Meiothermus sp.]|uniref:helix-turn-helix domain-containing protein n=1 Tax=Meiothermus sp. TaxID=1955249 RepID=UPI00307DD148